MGSWHLVDGFGLSNLRWVDAPDPLPGPGEVRIRVCAVSLNYRDLLIVSGSYNPRLRLPMVPGSDAVGLIDVVGPGVSPDRLGERVNGQFCPLWRGGEQPPAGPAAALGGGSQGAFGETLVIPAEAAIPVPAHLDDLEAATLPCAAVTAFRALFVSGALRPGQTVLTMGLGGVSLFALQLARAAGARVGVVTSSPARAEIARSMGAEAVFLRGDGPLRWATEVLDWTQGRGVDHVLELGGAGTLSQSIRAVRSGGHIALVGVLAGADPQTTQQLPQALTTALMKGVRIQGIFVGSGEDHRGLCAALAANPTLRPVIGLSGSLSELPAALAQLRTGELVGKVGLRVGGAVGEL